MNAAALKRDIETVLGLAGPNASRFWQAAAAGASGSAAFDPTFTGGVFVATSAASRPLTARPSTPGGGKAPQGDLRARAPVGIQGAGEYFNGQYVVTSVQHTVPDSSYKDEFLHCLRAVLAGDEAARRARPIWMKVKLKLEMQPARARQALGHELVHVMQQRTGRP